MLVHREIITRHRRLVFFLPIRAFLTTLCLSLPSKDWDTQVKGTVNIVQCRGDKG